MVNFVNPWHVEREQLAAPTLRRSHSWFRGGRVVEQASFALPGHAKELTSSRAKRQQAARTPESAKDFGVARQVELLLYRPKKLTGGPTNFQELVCGEEVSRRIVNPDSMVRAHADQPRSA